MYLQKELKDGSARFVIQGLTWTSESYEEAIKYLKEWYDRPRLVQEEHIRSIVDAVPGKNSGNKELRCLYGAEIQHAADSDTAAEAGRKDTIKVGGV